MRTIPLLAILVGVVIVCGVDAAKDDYNVIARLYNTLMKDYNKYARPVIDHTQTVNVVLGITALRLRLNEADHKLEMNAFFQQNWKDSRLSWKPEDYQGLGIIHIPADKIWKPDMALYNNIEYGTHFETLGDVNVVVYPDGSVIHVPPAQFHSICHPDLRRWPFDQQTCRLIIGSWTQDGYKVDLSIKENATEIDVEYMDQSGDKEHWSLVKSSMTIERKIYKCCKEPYPSLNVAITLQRNSSFFKFTVIVPLFVIVLLTLATFFLPPKSSGKILIGLISLLILCIYLVYFNQALPTPGNSVPLVVSFISASVVLVGFSLVVAVAATNWLTAPRSNPPAWIVKSLTALHGFPCSICPLFPAAATAGHVAELEKPSDQVNEVESQWTQVVLAVDRLILLVYGTIFSVMATQFILA